MKLPRKETVILLIYIILTIIGISLVSAGKSNEMRIAGGSIIGFVAVSFIGVLIYKYIKHYY